MGTFEQSAVAAIANHDRMGGMSSDRGSVDLFGGDVASSQCPDFGGELLVEDVVEAETMQGIEQLLDFCGVAGRPGAGKKYDFHRRSFRKNK